LRCSSHKHSNYYQYPCTPSALKHSWRTYKYPYPHSAPWLHRDSHEYSDSYPISHFSPSDQYTHKHCYADEHPDGDTHEYSYPVCDPKTADQHSHSNTDSHTDEHPYCVTDSHAHPYADSHIDSLQYSDSHAYYW
jgi:hypothetical protein